MPLPPHPTTSPATTQVAFVATGASKAEALARNFDAGVPAEERLPCARVRQADGDGAPTWFVDVAAAAGL